MLDEGTSFSVPDYTIEATFNPQGDITAYELAVICKRVKLPSKIISFTPSQWAELSATTLSRHFVKLT